MAQPSEFPLHNVELDSETTWQSDIFLAESSARFEQEWPGLRWDLAFVYNAYSIEYEPFRPYDLFGFDEAVHEDRFAGQATIRPKIGDAFTLIASGGIHEGFSDYRRVWINNYYRQQYNDPRFPKRPGYQEAYPRGWNLSAGARWEYWPELGFVEARGGYAVEEVAPGYVDDPATGGVIRGRSTLYTTSASVAFENVLFSRLRALNELRVSDTTERDVRWSWQTSLNCVLGERWVFRPLGGYTIEEPEFEAFWFGAALEFQATAWCALIASAHYYEDTGEVLEPLLFSTAAPALQTQQVSLGVRFTWSRFVVKISGGPYNTDYESLSPPSRPFTNLYRDRNWALAQATFAVSF